MQHNTIGRSPDSGVAGVHTSSTRLLYDTSIERIEELEEDEFDSSYRSLLHELMPPIPQPGDADVGRVSTELSACRSRLEAGVQDNRRNREVIQGLSDQIQRFRQRTAEQDALISASRAPSQVSFYPGTTGGGGYQGAPSLSHHRSLGRLDQPPQNAHAYSHQVDSLLDAPLYSPTRYEQLNVNIGLGGLMGGGGGGGGGGGAGGAGGLGGLGGLGVRGGHGGSGQAMTPHSRTQHSLNTTDIDVNPLSDLDSHNLEMLMIKLKSELFKNNTLEEMNEMLKEEATAATQANQHLRADVHELNAALEALSNSQRNEQSRWRDENMRYRQQVDNQHRQLIALWKAFTAVKRQVRELHTSTAQDLDKQMTEFTRCAGLMQRAIRQAENKNLQLERRGREEKDEAMEEVMSRYEQLSEKLLDCEKEASEKARKIARLESSLRRCEEDKEASDQALERVCQMPELVVSTTRTRARSASPGSYLHGVNDAQRKIRNAIAAKNGEIRELQTSVERADMECERLKRRLEKCEKDARFEAEQRKGHEEESRKKEQLHVEIQRREQRLIERTTMLEQEKVVLTEHMERAQVELAGAHKAHKEFIEDLMARHSEELQTRRELAEKELEQREQEAEGKLSKLQSELDRLRTEGEKTRQQLRETGAELAAVRRQLDEKDHSSSILEDELTRLRSQLAELEETLQQKEREREEGEAALESVKDKSLLLSRELTEARSTVAVLQDEISQLQENNAQLRLDIAEGMERAEEKSGEVDELRQMTDMMQVTLEERAADYKQLQKENDEQRIRIEELTEKDKQSSSEVLHYRSLMEEKVKELTETIKQREQINRDKELALEDLMAAQTEVNTLGNKLASMEKQAEEARETEDQLRSLLEEVKASLERLHKENGDQKHEIGMLNEQLKDRASEMERVQQQKAADAGKWEEDRRAKEQEWKEQERDRKEEGDRVKALLESQLRESQQKSADLDKKCEVLRATETELREQLSALLTQQEEEKRRHRQELGEMREHNEQDRDEWDVERVELEKAKQTLVQQMRDEIKQLTKELTESTEKEKQQYIDLDELREELQNEQQKNIKLQLELEEKNDSLSKTAQSSEHEKSTMITQIEQTRVEITRITSHLEEMTRKKELLEREREQWEKDGQKKSTLLSDHSSRVDALEHRLREADSMEQMLRDEIAVLERQAVDIKATNDRISNKYASEQAKCAELEQKLRDSNKSLHSLELRLQAEHEGKVEGEERGGQLAAKISHLELQLADRTAQCQTSSEMLRKMESEGHRHAKEFTEEREKCEKLQSRVDELTVRLHSLEHEAHAAKMALDRKTTSSKSCTEELVARVREAEKRATDALAEAETAAAKAATLTAKMDRAERSRSELSLRLEDVERRFEESKRQLHQYEQSAQRALQMASSHSPLRPGSSTFDLSRDMATSGFGSFSHLRNSSSSHDVSIPSPDRSVRFGEIHIPPAGPSGRSRSQQREGRGERRLDISTSMDITLRCLKERIEQLERDKAQLERDLHRETGSAEMHEKRSLDTASQLQRLQRQVEELEQANKVLESRAASQRQVYLSNEEQMRSREHEYRTLKSRITSAELHVREKESVIGTLTAQLDALRAETAAAEADRQRGVGKARAAEEEARRLDDLRLKAESDRAAARDEADRATAQLKALSKRMEEFESSEESLKRTVLDLKKSLSANRETIDRLQQEERHWRQTAAAARKSTDDQRRAVLDERVTALQRDCEAAVNRNEQLNAELDRVKSDLRDSLARLSRADGRAAELERRLADTAQHRDSGQQQLAVYAKMETEWTRLEREMREELKLLRRDKLALAAEAEDAKRRAARLDSERKETESQRMRLEREVAALKKHLESLEEEKNRTDVAVRETAAERKAMDRSLAAMERENSELYRNCAQLQTQISQLERDTGARSTTRLLREQSELEGRIAKLQQEKRQLELVCDQKDQNFAHKRKMLESQINMLREQLEAERRRRLEGQREVRLPVRMEEARMVRHASYRMSRTSSANPRQPFRP